MLTHTIETTKKIIIMAGYFFLILSSTLASAATYYIDASNGRDTNSGVSPTAAWQTLAKANSQNYNPGDFILLKRGETWQERLWIVCSGQQGNPVTYGAYGDPALPRPVIDATGYDFGIITYNYNVSNTIWPDYVTISDLEIKNAGQRGIYMPTQDYNAEHQRNIRIANCVVHDIPPVEYDVWTIGTAYNIDNMASHDIIYYDSDGFTRTRNYKCLQAHVAAADTEPEVGANWESYWIQIAFHGIDFRGSDITVDNCEIYNTNHDGVYGQGNNITVTDCNIHHVSNHNSEGDCIHINKSPDFYVARNNLDHSNNNHKQCFIVLATETAGGGIFEHNNCVLNQGDESKTIFIGSSNTIVRYNRIAGGTYGIWITAEGCRVYYNIIKGARDRNIVVAGNGAGIYNNVITDTDSGIYVSSYNGIVLNNNIIADCSYGIYSTGSITENYNCFYNNSANINHPLGENSIVQNPLFANYAAGDLYLQPGSPAIDAGINLGLTQDFAGQAVPQGTAPEIGAYEYVLFTATPTPTSKFLLVYPQPSRDKVNFRFKVTAPQLVKINIYNPAGMLVSTINSQIDPQQPELIWQAPKSAAGVYFYTTQIGAQPGPKRKIVVKSSDGN